ncbi:MAG: serine/threonine protein kinase [Planctomycetia bacterium]|nr:serine/threonine protein kinase [Planctomycetia bacterium]
MVGKVALEKYRVLRSLGSGSNAEVFLAEPLRYPNYRVVVKRIHDHVVGHAKFRTLFEAEVRSMKNFEHPYAVRLLEASLDDPLGPCLVMEYVPGVTLEYLLSRQKKLSPQRVGRLLGCFCHALHAAHHAGIIHRDLKPANLMVLHAHTPEESLKVMDFGFAGFAAKPHLQLAELTGRGPIQAMGTPAYVSPEMIRGDPVDCRSDLYSVGVILYEMLTGRLPFHYETQDRLLSGHLYENPPRFSKIGCHGIPAPVEAVVQFALSKYANERHQTALELAESYSMAIGEDCWESTMPAGWEPMAGPISNTPQARPAPDLPENPFHITHQFEAHLPERMAAVKLRGFVEDYRGQVMASEPGVIRLRLGVPPGYKESSGTSGVLSWFSLMRRPSVARGQEPIEVELHLEKRHPSQTTLTVRADFRPLKDYPPKDRYNWQERCEKLHRVLRQYLGV